MKDKELIQIGVGGLPTIGAPMGGGTGSGGGGGAVASVNGKTGVVVLDAEDVGAATAAQVQSVADDVATNTQDIENLQAAYAGLTQSDIVPLASLPSSGVANTIYRIAGADSYSDYMWDGSDFVLMATYDNAIDDVPTAGSDNLVKSGGVWDGCFIEDSTISVDLSQYTEELAAINSANDDWVKNLSDYRGKFIDISGKQKCVITATANGSSAALLKSTSGTKADYATGTGYISIQANETKECFIPEDANYLWVYTYHTGTDKTPSVSLVEFKDTRCCYTRDSGFDFSVEDMQKNVILGIDDGQIKTKGFNSADIKNIVEAASEDFDFSIKDSNGEYVLGIENGNIHTKNFHSDSNSVQKISKSVSDTYVIAAFDSDVKSKNSADIVCDGINDSLLIENCIKSIQGSCGTLIFCAGTYKMTFKQETSTNYVAILIPANNKQINLQAQHFNGVTHTQVFFEVDQATYEALEDEGIEYSIIKHPNCSNVGTHLTYHLNSHLKLQGIGFKVYDNQKPVTCINCQYTGQIYMDECRGLITARPYVGDGELTIVPSINCVFFKGLSGSSHASDEIKNSWCLGFGIGWGLQGEHLYVRSAVAQNCLYGFVFNYFPKNYGMLVHPMILIDCIEECDMNFPIFGSNPKKQSILIYNWHIEHKKAMFDMEGGGHYATETTPGQWYGHIDYAIQYFPVSTTWQEEHNVDIPFWAEGCGHNMESVNVVQKKIATTAERISYAPNCGQTIFDTNLNKICVCINPDEKTWVDANGTEIDS